MTKEKTQEYGTVRQNYFLKLKYSRDIRKDGIVSKETIERETKLDVDPCRHGSLFQIRSILDFQKGANAILKVQGGLGGRLVCGSGTLCFCLRGRA